MSKPAQQPARAQHVSNFRQGMFARGATLLVPAVLSLVALAGVSTGPVLEKVERKLALQAAQRHVAELSNESAQHAAQAKEHTQVTALAALTKVRGLIPSECTPVLAHGLIRAAAARSGVGIQSLEVGIDRSVGLADTSDRIVALEVRLGGKASLTGVLDFLATLRGLGFPTTIFGAFVQRREPHSTRFEYRLELGLLHYAPLAAGANPSASQ